MHGILLLNAAQARIYLLLQAISNSVILCGSSTCVVS